MFLAVYHRLLTQLSQAKSELYDRDAEGMDTEDLEGATTSTEDLEGRVSMLERVHRTAVALYVGSHNDCPRKLSSFNESCCFKTDFFWLLVGPVAEPAGPGNRHQNEVKKTSAVRIRIRSAHRCLLCLCRSASTSPVLIPRTIKGRMAYSRDGDQL